MGKTQHHERDLLRLATAGSVDDGKSTLIGRLLYDTKSVLADQLAAVERASVARGGAGVDLALLTDGLRAEREQGRRHAAIAALLRVPHIVLAVNKMDLVDFDEATFRDIAADFARYAADLGVRDVQAIPLSALEGDNVVDASTRTPWYDGPTLLAHLEDIPVDRDPTTEAFRFPVQVVIRPAYPEHPDYRGYAGRVASGVVRVGDEVVVLPAGGRTRVVGIGTADGELTQAFAPQSVTLRLADDLDLSRGDVLAPADAPPVTGSDRVGTVCWLSKRAPAPGARVLVRIGTRTVRGVVRGVGSRVDIDRLTVDEDAASLALNEIGTVHVRLAEPGVLDAYAEHRRTGAVSYTHLR